MSTTINFDTENFGKLFIRFFIGVYFAITGVHFFVGGHNALVLLGKILQVLGINFSPMLFGVILASMHIVCGMTILLGFLFRSSCFLLGSITLLEAVIEIYMHNSIFNRVLPTFLLSMIIYGMMFIGKGKFSVTKN